MIKQLVSFRDLKTIKVLTTNSFKDVGSPSYKEKLVYKLLNLSKGGNQKEFFSNILKVLNSNIENPNVKELVRKLMDIYPLSERDFEKVSYAIIMSIMSSIEDKKQKEV